MPFDRRLQPGRFPQTAPILAQGRLGFFSILPESSFFTFGGVSAALSL
jgi:hypothetical protein